MTNSTSKHPDQPLKTIALRSWGPRGTAAATFGSRLVFDNVCLNYGKVEAVRGVSFELEPGEIVCLLGPSGCGKTSLLRLAAGAEIPDRGTVSLDGKLVAGKGAFVPPEKRNVGLMFQDFALFPHLSILENVSFGLRHLDRKTARLESLAALQRVGLGSYGDHYPSELSGGEQQRVALARTIVPRPSIVLMDEPFSGLDQRLRDNVRRETQALLKETRASAMLVTHDPIEAMGIADRILLMRNGQLIQSGSPEELYRHPVDLQTARFFCDFTEVPGTIKQGKIATPLGVFELEDKVTDGEGLMLIRPHAISAVPGREGQLTGKVLQSRFLGEITELRVQFIELDEVVIRASTRRRPKPGDILEFDVEKELVLIFASDGMHTHVK
jgi:iron(III) transport system ATP-binding protein